MGENKKRKCLLDSALDQKSSEVFLVTSGNGKLDNRATLFSRGKRTNQFFTERSGLYITPRERELMRKGVVLNRNEKGFDSLGFRIVRDYMKYRPTKKRDRLMAAYLAKLEAIQEGFESVSMQTLSFWRGLSLTRIWNISMIGAILFGMVSMSFIYRYLGPGASADSEKQIAKSRNERVVEKKNDYPQSKVLGEEDEKERIKDGVYFESVLNDLIEAKKEESEEKIRQMVKGYPIEEMVPFIAEKDPIVAAFLVAIARKESGWGVHVPVLNGQDCYNYWGYRGIRKLMGTGGHTCFNSRKDAVDTVAKRIEFLVSNKKLDTPAKMVIWKCGSNCAVTGGQAAANKWIADVDYYFKKLNDV